MSTNKYTRVLETSTVENSGIMKMKKIVDVFLGSTKHSLAV